MNDLPRENDLTRTTVGVVVPVYSGENYLKELVALLNAVHERWETSGAPLDLLEIILVDDAAIDGSSVIVDGLSQEYARVTAIHLSRNFGQHAATAAGILYSSADWIVTLDEDLQHPPAQIEALLREAAEGSRDIVYGRPSANVHGGNFRDFSSVVIKRLVGWISKNKNVPLFSSFRIIRGPVARAAASICGHESYFDVVLSWFTERVASVEMELTDVRHVETGRSGYNLRRLLHHARRLVMSSPASIFRWAALIALLVQISSVIFGIFVLAGRIFFPQTVALEGWASLILTTVLFGGVIVFLLGVALEYLIGLTLIVHGKPVFFVVDRSRDAGLTRYFKGVPR